MQFKIVVENKSLVTTTIVFEVYHFTHLLIFNIMPDEQHWFN